MSGSQRDAGLVRTVGPWSLAANIISMIVGAGIFVVPAALAASMGAYAPLAFLAGGIAMGCIAVCFAEGGSRIPTSGGAYGYIDAAFGPLPGYVAGTLLWLGDVLACGGVAAALADAIVTVVPPPFRTAAHAAVIVCVLGAIACVNVRGVSQGARLINIATVLKLIPLLILVFAGFWLMRIQNFSLPFVPQAHGMGRGVILALFALTGMEGSLIASGEVRNPSRAIPRALAIAISFVVALYVAIQVVAWGLLGPSLSRSSAPLVDAMARIGPGLRALMLAGTALVMLGWLSSDLLSSPRMLFALGRDGLLPRVFGRVHPRSHAPHVSIVCYTLIAMVLALTGTFAELAVLSMLTMAVVYIGGCASAWWLAHTGLVAAEAPLSFRWLPAAAVIGIGSMLALIALASRAEIAGLAAVVVGSAAIYLTQTRFRPAKETNKTPVG